MLTEQQALEIACERDTEKRLKMMPVLLTDDEVTPWLHDTRMVSVKLTALQPALERIAA